MQADGYVKTRHENANGSLTLSVRVFVSCLHVARRCAAPAESIRARVKR